MSALAVQGIDRYRQAEVLSRTPLERVVMLYDGALRFADEAKAAIGRRDIPARKEAVSRVLAIVGELQSTLDLEAGGELASSLDSLYGFITSRLMSASFHQDAKPLDEAVRVLKNLRAGWAGIATPPGPGKDR